MNREVEGSQERAGRGGPEEGSGQLCLPLLTGQEVSQTESTKSNRFGYMGVNR